MLAIGLQHASLLLLMGGLGLGLYLVATARHEQQRSAALSAVAERTVDLVSTLREERRTSSERLAVPGGRTARPNPSAGGRHRECAPRCR